MTPIFQVRCVFALACVMSAPSATAQVDQYHAAARLRTWMYAAQGIAARCTKAFPDLAAPIEAHMSTWRRADQVAMERADKLWRAMEATSPRSSAEEREDVLQLEGLWRNMAEQQPHRPPPNVKATCLRYFEVRANGVLRSNWPEVFQALEAR
ncbi:hypothetical protein [Inhella proteolytica]|nr:hypothetical protein [Inhella proteolytica]